MNPSQAQVEYLTLAKQIANLPADVRAQIQGNYADGEIQVLPLPYWSTVRIGTTRAAGPPVTFTIATGERKAFGYQIGQSMAVAGFPAARIATEAETNLLQASTTRDNADVWIWGLAAYVTQESEPALARRVFRDASLRIALNGTTQIPLGTLEMFPAAGGLYGAGVSYIKSPDISSGGAVDNGAGAIMPFVNNGNPMAGNFFRLNQPFKWASLGSRGADSALILSLLINTAATETAGLARAAVAAGTPNIPAGAFTPPLAADDPGTFVDIRFHLVCVSVAKRSVNT